MTQLQQIKWLIVAGLLVAVAALAGPPIVDAFKDSNAGVTQADCETRLLERDGLAADLDRCK